MRKLMTLGLTMLGISLLLGCATSWQTAGGKFLSTTAVTTDGAMKGWAVWVIQGKATSSDEAQVRTLYGQYQTYMAVATNAYHLAVTTGDPALWSPASNNLFSAKSGLAMKLSTAVPVK